MKQVTITKHLFDTFAFPQIAQANAKTDGEWETALRLIKKFKDPALTRETPLNKMELRAKDDGQKVAQFYELLEDQVTFVFQDDEFHLMKDRITGNKTNISILLAEDFQELLQAIEDAEDVKEPEPVGAEE